MPKSTDQKLDELSQLVETAFTGVAADISDIKHSLGAFSRRFDKVDERLTAVESKVDGINHRLDTEAMQRTDRV